MSSPVSTDLTSRHRSLKHSLLSKQKGLVVLFFSSTSSSFKLFLWTCTLPFVSYGCSLSSWYYTCSNTLNFLSPVSLETLISLASLKDPYLLKLLSWLEVSSLLCLAVSQLSGWLFLSSWRLCHSKDRSQLNLLSLMWPIFSREGQDDIA